MSPQKLLEMALLDASGVLDHDESAEFERAFASADDDLKAQVRREQARFADVTEILPDVSPRPELRSRVIDSVREASGRQRDAVGRAILTHAAGERAASGPRRHRGPLAWRLATFAFATAFAAVGVMAFQLNQEFTEVSNNIARNERIDTLLRSSEHAGFLSALLDDSFAKLALTTGDDDAQGSIFFNPDSGEGYLAFRKLPELEPGTRYVLVALGDDDEIIGDALARFTSGGETKIIEFEHDADLAGRFALAIESPTGLEFVYRTA